MPVRMGGKVRVDIRVPGLLPLARLELKPRIQGIKPSLTVGEIFGISDQTARSTITGTWSDGLSQPRASLMTEAPVSLSARFGETQI